MRRLLVGCLALGLVVLASPADDKKVEKAAKPQEIFQELVTKYRAAKSNTERQELFRTYSQKLLDYAEKNAKAESAVEALFLVLQIPAEGKDNPKTRALAILMKEYVKDPKLGKQLRRFPASGDDEAAMAFLKAVVKDNPDRSSQAYAAKALVKAQEQLTMMASQLKENEKLKEQFEKVRGKETVEKILAAAAKADAVAKEYKDKLRNDFKDLFPDLTVGATAPEVESKDLDGKPVKLSQYKGKVVVLDIWATWCGPCRAMIPHTRKLVEKMKDKPFVFISISADDKVQTVQDFIKKEPMPWTHWYEGQNGKMMQDWEVEYFPTIYVLDHKGVIRYKDVRGEKMDEAVEILVKEAEEAGKAKSE